MQIPASFGQKLLGLATFYGRLAREDQQEGGLYFGRQKLAPDAFAVDAERAFRDFSRRLGQKAFALQDPGGGGRAPAAGHRGDGGGRDLAARPAPRQPPGPASAPSPPTRCGSRPTPRSAASPSSNLATIDFGAAAGPAGDLGAA